MTGLDVDVEPLAVGHDGTNISARRGRLVLSPVGELDLVTGPPLVAAARKLILRTAASAADRQPTDPAPRLVIDLGGITFIDSAGVKCLLAIHRAAQAHGTTAELVHARPQVHKVITLLGVNREIPLQPSTAGSTS